MQKLPSAEQDAVAAIILDEIADEKQWQDQFAGSQNQLARWAEKVRADIAAG